MKKLGMVVGISVIIGSLSSPAPAQRAVEANTLKLSPAGYKNSYIKLQDSFINIRSGIPLALTKAGYTLDKYLAFAAVKAGMKCFMRRNAASEKEIAQLKNGDQITICGYVKQPKATVGAGSRWKHKEKLDIYIIEVSKISKGWD